MGTFKFSTLLAQIEKNGLGESFLLPTILNMTLTASLVILFVLALRLALKKAPKIFSYALWAAVLFRLLCPVSISTNFSLLGLFDTPTAENTQHTTAVEYVPYDVVHTTQLEVHLPVPPAINQAVNDALPQDHAAQGADPLEGEMSIAAMLWLLGIAAMLIYGFASYLALRNKLIGTVQLRSNIYLADVITSPFVMGLFRPKIYLPSSLSDQERGYIILHEHHHIRRGDHIIKLLAFAALCIHWFNPLVWLAFVLSAKDMEMSCDEAVVKRMGDGIRADYSASLLSLATGRRIIAGTPLAFGEGDTKSRIRNMLNWKKPKTWIICFALIVCLLAAAVFATNPSAQMRDLLTPGSAWANEEYQLQFSVGEDLVAEGTFGYLEKYSSLRQLGSDISVAYRFAGRRSAVFEIYRGDWATAQSGAEAPLLSGMLHVKGGKLVFEVETNHLALGAKKIVFTPTQPPVAPAESICVPVWEAKTLLPGAVTEITDYVAEQVSYYNALGTENAAGGGTYSIVEAKVTGVEKIATGTAALDHSIELYRLEYRLLPSAPENIVLAGGMQMDGEWITEWSSAGQPYLALLCDLRQGEEVWTLLGVTNTDSIAIDYGSDEMLARYGNEYTAAAMELYGAYLVRETGTAYASGAADAVYYLELAAGEAFQDMSQNRRNLILEEYGDLLNDYTLIARESTDEKSAYIVGQYTGNGDKAPLAGTYSIELSAPDEDPFLYLYPEDSLETVEEILAENGTDFPSEAGWRIEDSWVTWVDDGKYVLIQPCGSELTMDVAWNRYFFMPNGREYIADAAARGIDVCNRSKTYLYVYLISERFGEIAERIALSEDEALAIAAEERVSILDGFGLAASLHIGDETVYYNEHTGIPQTVLDLAVERCDYRFGDPGMIKDTVSEARLDCAWLDEPLYADTDALPRLREILKNAEFGYVGACGYDAKLTLTFTGGEKLTMFKGCDGCDSIVFGSYGGYFLGDAENTEFWEIFGLDVDTKLPLAFSQKPSSEEGTSSLPVTATEVNKDIAKPVGTHEYIHDQSEYTRYLLISTRDQFTNIRIHSMSLEDTGMEFADELCTFPEFTSQTPLLFGAVFYGDMTTYGLILTDGNGTEHQYMLYESGEDGSVVIQES